MGRASTMAGALLVAMGLPLAASAGSFVLSGTNAFQRDVSWVSFTVASGGADVLLFTDSHQGGLNFDPLITLWSATGFKLDQADDISPGTGGFDARLELTGLAAGSYKVSITASPNSPLGSQISEGFLYDTRLPEALSAWCQPAAFDCGAGTMWRLNLQGVQTAQVDNTSPVPEPASALLLLGGLAAVVGAARRRSA